MARWVGYVVSPLTLPSVLVAVVLWFFRAPLAEAAVITGAVFVLLGAAPAFLLIWMVRSGRATSLQVSDTRARIALLAFALAGGLATLWLVAQWGVTAKPVVIVLIAAYLLNVLLLLVVSRYWKISLHAAAAAGFAAANFYLAGFSWRVPHGEMPFWIAAVASILVVAGVGWARVTQRLHTISQVIAGGAVGAVTTAIGLLVAHRLGLMAAL